MYYSDAKNTALNETNSLTSSCLHSSEKRHTKNENKNVNYIVCQMVRNAKDKNKEEMRVMRSARGKKWEWSENTSF